MPPTVGEKVMMSHIVDELHPIVFIVNVVGAGVPGCGHGNNKGPTINLESSVE